MRSSVPRGEGKSGGRDLGWAGGGGEVGRTGARREAGRPNNPQSPPAWLRTREYKFRSPRLPTTLEVTVSALAQLRCGLPGRAPRGRPPAAEQRLGPRHPLGDARGCPRGRLAGDPTPPSLPPGAAAGLTQPPPRHRLGFFQPQSPGTGVGRGEAEGRAGGGAAGKDPDGPVPGSRDASGKTLLHAHPHTNTLTAARRCPGSTPSGSRTGGRKEVAGRKAPELLRATFRERGDASGAAKVRKSRTPLSIPKYGLPCLQPGSPPFQRGLERLGGEPEPPGLAQGPNPGPRPAPAWGDCQARSGLPKTGGAGGQGTLRPGCPCPPPSTHPQGAPFAFADRHAHARARSPFPPSQVHRLKH